MTQTKINASEQIQPGTITPNLLASAANFNANMIVQSISALDAGGTINLTASSAPTMIFTGSVDFTIVLPNATTLLDGAHYEFLNRASANVFIQLHDITPLVTVEAGTDQSLLLTNNSTSNGVWEQNITGDSASTIFFDNSNTEYSSNNVQGALVEIVHFIDGDNMFPNNIDMFSSGFVNFTDAASSRFYANGMGGLELISGVTSSVLLLGANGEILVQDGAGSQIQQNGFGDTYIQSPNGAGLLFLGDGGGNLSETVYNDNSGNNFDFNSSGMFFYNNSTPGSLILFQDGGGSNITMDGNGTINITAGIDSMNIQTQNMYQQWSSSGVDWLLDVGNFIFQTDGGQGPGGSDIRLLSGATLELQSNLDNQGGDIVVRPFHNANFIINTDNGQFVMEGSGTSFWSSFLNGNTFTLDDGGGNVTLTDATSFTVTGGAGDSIIMSGSITIKDAFGTNLQLDNGGEGFFQSQDTGTAWFVENGAAFGFSGNTELTLNGNTGVASLFDGIGSNLTLDGTGNAQLGINNVALFIDTGSEDIQLYNSSQLFEIVGGSYFFSGGTNVDFGGMLATNGQDPVNPKDLATKSYVDAAIGPGVDFWTQTGAILEPFDTSVNEILFNTVGIIQDGFGSRLNLDGAGNVQLLNNNSYGLAIASNNSFDISSNNGVFSSDLFDNGNNHYWGNSSFINLYEDGTQGQIINQGGLIISDSTNAQFILSNNGNLSAQSGSDNAFFGLSDDGTHGDVNLSTNFTNFNLSDFDGSVNISDGTGSHLTLDGSGGLQLISTSDSMVIETNVQYMQWGSYGVDWLLDVGNFIFQTDSGAGPGGADINLYAGATLNLQSNLDNQSGNIVARAFHNADIIFNTDNNQLIIAGSGVASWESLLNANNLILDDGTGHLQLITGSGNGIQVDALGNTIINGNDCGISLSGSIGLGLLQLFTQNLEMDFDDSTNTYRLGGGGTFVDIQTASIINVLDPINPQDGATKNYIDSNFLKVTDKHSFTTQGANITPANFSISGAGLYRINYYLVDTANDLTAGTVSAIFTYVDDSGAQNEISPPMVLTTLGANQSGSFVVESASGNITYATNHTGIFATAKYSFYTSIEKIL